MLSEVLTNHLVIGRNTIFYNDFTREEEQVAFFGEFSFDLSDQVTVKFGARNYDLDFALRGSTGSSFGCRFFDPSLPANANDPRIATRADGSVGCNGTADNNVTSRLQALGDGSLAALIARFGSGVTAAVDDPTTTINETTGVDPTQALNNAEDIFDDIQNGSLNVNGLGADGAANQTDTIIKASIDWKPSDNILWFATYSEGFRPQTTNRNASARSGNQTGVFQNFRVAACSENR